MTADGGEREFLDGFRPEKIMGAMRLMLLVVSSLTLLLGLWAGTTRPVAEVPPGHLLIEAGREVEKLPEAERDRIQPLIDQGGKNLEGKIEQLRAKFDGVFVAAVLIALVGLIAGIRGPSKRT